MGFGRPFPDRLKRYDPRVASADRRPASDQLGFTAAVASSRATAEEDLKLRSAAFDQLQCGVRQLVGLRQNRNAGLLEHLRLGKAVISTAMFTSLIPLTAEERFWA